MLLDALTQFGVGEPDEILKARRDKLSGVAHVQFEFGSRRGIRVVVSDVGEDSHVAQTAGGFFEIVVVDRHTHLQAGSCGNRLLGKPLASGNLDGDQLPRRSGHLRERLLRGRALPHCRQADAGWKNEHQEQKSGGRLRHRLGMCANSSVDLCFTAMSMKARAARLRALSLRKTSARSRRTCASAIAIATRTLARTSSSTLDRAMNPTPTSAATKRFSSSLESSSMVKFGFSRRSWNSCSIPSRVCPALGTTRGNFAMSATVADFIFPKGCCGGAIRINSSRWMSTTVKRGSVTGREMTPKSTELSMIDSRIFP